MSEQPKHTPGPWQFDGYGVFNQNNEPIAQIVGARSSVIHSANARLIAAAPELLEAAEWARDVLLVGYQVLGISPDNSGAYQELLDAIAKAQRS